MKTFIKLFFSLAVVVFIVAMFIPKDKASVERDALADNATPDTASPAPAPAKPDLEILKFNETTDDEGFMKTVHVKVKNNSDHLIKFATLKSVYYNKKGDIVGTGTGAGTNIASGATKTVDIMATEIDNAAKYEVEIDNVIAD